MNKNIHILTEQVQVHCLQEMLNTETFKNIIRFSSLLSFKYIPQLIVLVINRFNKTFSP